ncbi:hypothetical protein AFLA_013478 [Aspergillus flavus NRRL3357]|nr:hypothetical protein AFLA_013478 [Aspergillus flavus NRRL3357]
MVPYTNHPTRDNITALVMPPLKIENAFRLGLLSLAVTPGRCIEVIKLCVESASGLAPSDMAVGELSREPGVIYNEMFRLSPRPHILVRQEPREG